MLIKKENKGSKSGVNTKVLQQSITKKGGGGKDRKSTKPSNLPELSTFGAKPKRITNKSYKHTKVSSTIFGVPLTESTPSVRPAYGGADPAPASGATASSGASVATAAHSEPVKAITIDNIHESSTSFIDNLNIHIPVDIFYNGFIINMNKTEYDKIILEYLQLQETNPTLIPLELTTNNDYFKTIIKNFKNNIKDHSNNSFGITYFDTLKELFKYELKYRFSNNNTDTLPNITKNQLDKTTNLFNTIDKHSIDPQTSTSWLRIISIYLNELVNTTYNDNYIVTSDEYNEIKKNLIYFELYFILKNILETFFSIDIIKKIFINIVNHTKINVYKIRETDYLNKYLKNIGLQYNIKTTYGLNKFKAMVIKDTYQHQFIYILKDVIYMVSSFFKILNFFKQNTLNLENLDKIQLFDTLNIIGVIKQNFLSYFFHKKSNLNTDKNIKDIDWAISNKISHDFFINYIKDKFNKPDYTSIFFTKHKSIYKSEIERGRERGGREIEEIIVPGGIEKFLEKDIYIWSDSKDKETNELDDYALVFVFMFYYYIKKKTMENINIISQDTKFLGIDTTHFQNFYDKTFRDKLNTEDINDRIFLLIQDDETIKSILKAPRELTPQGSETRQWRTRTKPKLGSEGSWKSKKTGPEPGPEPELGSEGSWKSKKTGPGRGSDGQVSFANRLRTRHDTDRKGGTRKNIKQLNKFTNKLSRKYKSYNTNKNKNSKKTF
jgi:hypothetical protein